MNMTDFDRACELLPDGVTWGEAITPSIVKHIAEAAQAQRTTELSDKCKVAASCLTYNDTEKEAVAKHLLLEASQELRRAQAQQESRWISVGEVNNKYGDPEAFAERSYYIDEQVLQTVPIGFKLVAIPPAPVSVSEQPEGDKE